MADDRITAAELFGSGAEPRGTRERILFTAVDLFYAHGFHAVGLDRILSAVGVTKTTFYNHFESRDALVVECIRLRDEWERETFERQVQEKAGYDPKAMLMAIFDVLDAWFNDPDYRGCLFIAATAEFPSPSHPAHRAAAAHFATMEVKIVQMARAAGVPAPEELARMWVVLLEGATAYRMVTGDDGVAKTVRAAAHRLLTQQLELARKAD